MERYRFIEDVDSLSSDCDEVILAPGKAV
jgi:hypothetical protein